MDLRKKKIFVGLSGGVDSSVSATLLLARGADVTGVFIKGWYPPFLNCDWKEERRDAMRVAAQLGIAFLTCDAEEEYKKHVVEYMVSEYKAGRTPNPDIMCNKYVKFGAFFDFAMKHGADFVATGHYARVVQIKNEKIKNVKSGIHLLKGRDENKDQSYFLWAVPKEQLSKTIFPIGDLKKDEVRKIAEKNKLFTAQKKDSQGLCFLGKVDLDEFLSHYIPHKEGNVLNEKGEVMGTHSGVHLYTIGERHGFTVSETNSNIKPHYIVAKNIEENTITVSEKISEGENTLIKGVRLSSANFNTEINENTIYDCRFRYRQTLMKCTVQTKNSEYFVTFENPQSFVPVGQSLVIYEGDACLGGGIIEKLL